MPWLYNSTRDVHLVELNDGTSCGFLPRKKTYVHPDNMSAGAWALVNARELINHGGDPLVKAVSAEPAAIATSELASPVVAEKPDTSSGHHLADDRLSVDSSNEASDVAEEVAEVQEDDLENPGSTQVEEGPEGSYTSRKADRRGRRSIK